MKKLIKIIVQFIFIVLYGISIVVGLIWAIIEFIVDMAGDVKDAIYLKMDEIL